MRLLVTVLAALLVHGTALAQEEEHAASGGLSVTGVVVIAIIAIGLPILFLVATQLPPRGEGEDEEIEPVVAGIGQGRAPVPRWLYAFYILIPAWALFYLFNNTEVRSELATPTPVPTPTPVATREPSGTAAPAGGPIRLVAKDLTFNATAIAARSGGQVTIELRNNDPATPHNVAVYKDEALAEAVFKGELFPGVATKTFTFPAPPPGSYHFQCDVHPTTMKGTLTVS